MRPSSPTPSNASMTSSVLEELQHETKSQLFPLLRRLKKKRILRIIMTQISSSVSAEDFEELLRKFKKLSNGKKELDKENFLKIMTVSAKFQMY